MKTLLELEPCDCRFVVDDNFSFCAAPKLIYHRNGEMVQSPYCAEHHPVCIVVPVHRVPA